MRVTKREKWRGRKKRERETSVEQTNVREGEKIFVD